MGPAGAAGAEPALFSHRVERGLRALPPHSSLSPDSVPAPESQACVSGREKSHGTPLLPLAAYRAVAPILKVWGA